MEYLNDHGAYAQLPYAELAAAYRKHYPQLLSSAERITGDMAAEIEADRKQQPQPQTQP